MELLCFAGTNALVPGVARVSVPGASTVSEPRTAAAATAEFAGFLHGATLEAGRTGERCRDC